MVPPFSSPCRTEIIDALPLIAGGWQGERAQSSGSTSGAGHMRNRGAENLRHEQSPAERLAIDLKSLRTVEDFSRC